MIHIKPKTVNYHFPDSENPSSMKIFQDKSSQIRGIYFDRESINKIAKEEYATNYAIYFLVNRNDDTRKIYVGQSRVGVKRIYSHCKNKDFWTHCIMFVADNNVFDANVIDYLEYYFINCLKESLFYKMTNVEQRDREPNLNYFDKLTYQMFIEQIEFLLKAENINLNEKQPILSVILEIAEDKMSDTSLDINLEDVISESEEVVYEALGKDFHGKLKMVEGKYTLLKGSFIIKPKVSMLNWSDSGRAYYRITKLVDSLVIQGKLNDCGKTCEVIENIDFTSPSSAGELVRGGPVNGWTFFKGLSDVR